MDEEKKTKPVKEKKKREKPPGQRKEKKSKVSLQQQQGRGVATGFLGQPQQLQQREGVAIGDSHTHLTGRLPSHLSSGAISFATSQHGAVVSSAPSQPVRVHTTLPPKKSISPSRIAALAEERIEQQGHALALGQGRPWPYHFTGVPSSFPNQDTTASTSGIAAQLTAKPHNISIGRQEDTEQGGLLRQQLLQQRTNTTVASELSGHQEKKMFSPYQLLQNVSAAPFLHQKEEAVRAQAPPNVQVPTFGSKTETGRILGGHHSRALGLDEKIYQSKQSIDPGPGNIQLQRIVIPTTREDVHTTGSPGKRESQPQPAHLGEHISPPFQVSTIRRTPSPAHYSAERRSPAPTFGRSQDLGDKTQPVNLSIPELQKKHGTAHTTLTGPGCVLSSLYNIQSQAKAAQNQAMHQARISEQQHSTSKHSELPVGSLKRDEGGSISIPTQILNTVQSGGQLQNEILRQTLLRGMPAGATALNPGPLHVVTNQMQGAKVKEEQKAFDQGPVMYKFDSDGSRKPVSPVPHSRAAARGGPSPHHSIHGSPPRGIELKRVSPSQGTITHTSSLSQSGTQQPMRYVIPSSNVSPKMSTTSNQAAVPAEGFRPKIPSPKPQHRHKEQLAALHQTYAAKSGQVHSTAPSVSASEPTSHPSIQQLITAATPSAINLPANTGPIRQPVVSLVRLPENVQKPEEKRIPPHSVMQLPQDVPRHGTQRYTESRPEVSTGRSTVADIINAVQSQKQQQRQVVSQPQQINPFIFPPKAPAKLYTYHQAADHKEESTKMKRVTPPPNIREPQIADAADDMPRLLPISPFASRDVTDRTKDDRMSDKEEEVSLPNPFNMRLQNLANLPTTSIYRSSYRAHSVAVQRAKAGCIVSAAKSLDLLRQNIQRFINKEIDVIVQQYLEKFFKPGIENIKLNNGSNAVTEEHVQAVCRQILEEAKKMYLSDQGRQSVTPTRDIPDNVSESGSTGSRRIPFGRKRKPSDTDSEKSHALPKRKKGRPPVYISGRSTPSKLRTSEPVRREGPKWNHERLTLNSLFIMGARANKALGLGATRGRIYIKHPDLFKFSGDQDDKQWLYENHHMPATGGKAYMLLLEDVKELAQDDEYRDNGNLLPHELIGFTIPDWMLEKVKAQMMANRTDGQKKSVRSRSTTPSELPVSVLQDDDDDTEDLKHIPFSSFSEQKSSQLDKDDMQTSPSGDTEMEFLSGADNDDQAFTRMSPFTLTGGFDEASPSPSDLDTLEDETPLSAPFDMGN